MSLGLVGPGDNIHDRKFWLKLRLILDRLESDNIDRVAELRVRQHLSLINYKHTSDQAFEEHWNRANALISDIWNRRFPWDKKRNNTASRLPRDIWTKYFGDPDDPNVQRQLDELVNSVRSNTLRNLGDVAPREVRRRSQLPRARQR